jgi:hypothetical protein
MTYWGHVGGDISPKTARVAIKLGVDELGEAIDVVMPPVQMVEAVVSLLSMPRGYSVVSDDPIQHFVLRTWRDYPENKALRHPIDAILVLLAVDTTREEEEIGTSPARRLTGFGSQPKPTSRVFCSEKHGQSLDLECHLPLFASEHSLAPPIERYQRRSRPPLG